MKRTNLLIMLALIGVAASFWQCGEDPPPAVDPQDAQLEKLSATWASSSVTFAETGTAQPEPGYENFQLTLSGTPGNDTFNYTTTGRPATLTPWDADGTFTFGSDFASTVTRDDGTVVTYFLTDTKLEMTFVYAGAGFDNSRTSNVNGTWTFTFDIQ